MKIKQNALNQYIPILVVVAPENAPKSTGYCPFKLPDEHVDPNHQPLPSVIAHALPVSYA